MMLIFSIRWLACFRLHLHLALMFVTRLICWCRCLMFTRCRCFFSPPRYVDVSFTSVYPVIFAMLLFCFTAMLLFAKRRILFCLCLRVDFSYATRLRHWYRRFCLSIRCCLIMLLRWRCAMFHFVLECLLYMSLVEQPYLRLARRHALILICARGVRLMSTDARVALPAAACPAIIFDVLLSPLPCPRYALHALPMLIDAFTLSLFSFDVPWLFDIDIVTFLILIFAAVALLCLRWYVDAMFAARPMLPFFHYACYWCPLFADILCHTSWFHYYFSSFSLRCLFSPRYYFAYARWYDADITLSRRVLSCSITDRLLIYCSRRWCLLIDARLHALLCHTPEFYATLCLPAYYSSAMPLCCCSFMLFTRACYAYDGVYVMSVMMLMMRFRARRCRAGYLRCRQYAMIASGEHEARAGLQITSARYARWGAPYSARLLYARLQRARGEHIKSEMVLFLLALFFDARFTCHAMRRLLTDASARLILIRAIRPFCCRCCASARPLWYAVYLCHHHNIIYRRCSLPDLFVTLHEPYVIYATFMLCTWYFSMMSPYMSVAFAYLSCCLPLLHADIAALMLLCSVCWYVTFDTPCFSCWCCSYAAFYAAAWCLILCWYPRYERKILFYILFICLLFHMITVPAFYCYFVSPILIFRLIISPADVCCFYAMILLSPDVLLMPRYYYFSMLLRYGAICLCVHAMMLRRCWMPYYCHLIACSLIVRAMPCLFYVWFRYAYLRCFLSMILIYYFLLCFMILYMSPWRLCWCCLLLFTCRCYSAVCYIFMPLCPLSMLFCRHLLPLFCDDGAYARHL